MSEQSDGTKEPPKVWPSDIRRLCFLNAADKCFLYTILSHQNGEMYRSAPNAAADMGVSVSTFYRSRRKLLQRMVLWQTQKPGHTTLYQVNPWGVHQWLEVQKMNPEERQQNRERIRLEREQDEREQQESTPSTDDRPTPVTQTDHPVTQTDHPCHTDRGSSTGDRPPLVQVTDKEVTRRCNNQRSPEEGTRRALAREDQTPRQGAI